jgi:hypothetical protein
MRVTEINNADEQFERMEMMRKPSIVKGQAVMMILLLSIGSSCLATGMETMATLAAYEGTPPNIIIIYADDMGSDPDPEHRSTGVRGTPFHGCPFVQQYLYTLTLRSADRDQSAPDGRAKYAAG